MIALVINVVKKDIYNVIARHIKNVIIPQVIKPQEVTQEDQIDTSRKTSILDLQAVTINIKEILLGIIPGNHPDIHQPVLEVLDQVGDLQGLTSPKEAGNLLDLKTPEDGHQDLGAILVDRQIPPIKGIGSIKTMEKVVTHLITHPLEMEALIKNTDSTEKIC